LSNYCKRKYNNKKQEDEMETQILNTVQFPGICGMHEGEKTTYVMQGTTENRALDVYHLILAPTHACNLRCKHCYLPDYDETLLTEDAALHLVDDWNEMVLKERGLYGGVFHVKGGEPLLVSYFSKIMKRLAELRSLRFMITTNGTFLDEDIFKRLKKLNEALDGRVTVIVSLDGNTEVMNSMLRGKGQFIKTSLFIKRLRENRINFHLNCVLHLGNIHTVSEYIESAREYGAAQVNFLSFVPRGFGSTFGDFQIPHLEAYHVLNTIYENLDDEKKELLSGSLSHIKYHEAHSLSRTSCECVAAYRGLLYITPNGEAYACPNLIYPEYSLGNIYKNSIQDITNEVPVLYEKVKNYGDAYVCIGEKIGYQRNSERRRHCMLMAAKNEFVVREGSARNIADSTRISYCYNRNW
jgi:MoaA/NifB/PqqE/SkfB family radical SAM enzyme